MQFLLIFLAHQRRALVGFSLLLLLVGCGFQLRGTSKPLSERFLYTELDATAAQNQRLSAQVRRLIQANRGKLVESKVAKVRVSLSAISRSERQVAISGDGYLKEYESTYSLTVNLFDIENNTLLGNRTVSTIRHFQLDDRQILSSDEQRDVVEQQAVRELSYQVLAYLTAF